MNAPVCGTCPCGCRLVQQSAWGKADTIQRREWLSQGLRLLQGRGLCRNCYMQAYKAGEIPPRKPKESGPKAPCGRCGILTATAVCRDCEDVMTRDELALWVA